MVTADQTGCCDLGLMTGMIMYMQKQEHPLALIPPSATVFLCQILANSRPQTFVSKVLENILSRNIADYLLQIQM